MAFVVEMVRGAPYTPEFEEYSCSDHTWDALLSLAQQFGWQPAGTVPDEWAARHTSGYVAWFKPTYRPDEWAHCKRLSDADARHLAAALRLAADSIRAGRAVAPQPAGPIVLHDSASAIEVVRANLAPVNTIDEFAAFLDNGEFAFAWDD
jgi:hypothetical protein